MGDSGEMPLFLATELSSIHSRQWMNGVGHRSRNKGSLFFSVGLQGVLVPSYCMFWPTAFSCKPMMLLISPHFASTRK